MWRTDADEVEEREWRVDWYQWWWVGKTAGLAWWFTRMMKVRRSSLAVAVGKEKVGLRKRSRERIRGRRWLEMKVAMVECEFD